MTVRTLSLPIITNSNPETTANWHGWNSVSPLEPGYAASSSPEPLAPQGEYGLELGSELVPVLDWSTELAGRPVELLAPAGGPDAAFAAFHFGADAIYLGLKKFSARAEAENFTLDEVAEVTAYAHALQPRRRVFVTINTLIQQDELGELVDALGALSDIGVDALIIQDLGVYYIVRTYFPELELHASTQLAVHNRAGAEALKRLGFSRVVLARELTFEEVRDITATADIETEVFIHGALCYSYSGLCLFSSQTLGRSGNRGKCSYSCRDSFAVTGAPTQLRDGSNVKRDPGQGFPFSMKDLALPDHIPALRAAGVSCFKVEGRKKSPLYVATTTDFYRKLIDGRLSPEERPAHEADMKAVFSRPWTRLFVQSHKDKEVADRDTVGHRGTPIGKVESLVNQSGGAARLRFRTGRALERHDGLQIDLPALGKPFGFAVDQLFLIDKKTQKAREVFEAAAGSQIEVGLPEDAPTLPIGALIYCSSSQSVKRRYRHDRPKPGHYHPRKPLRVKAQLNENAFTVNGAVGTLGTGNAITESTQTLPGPFASANDPRAMDATVRSVFEKLGDTRFFLDEFTFENSSSSFIPVSRLNHIRRQLISDLDQSLTRSLAHRIEHVRQEICSFPLPKKRPPEFRWSIKVDRITSVDTFEECDWEHFDELIVDISRDHPTLLFEKLLHWQTLLGRDRIRLALPALTRKWEEKGLLHKFQRLRSDGWHRWEAANLSAWQFLAEHPTPASSPATDLATDWSVYVVNRAAVLQLRSMGVTRFALSPEDGIGNIRSLLAEHGPAAVLIVYQDTPLFLAESCAYANLIGGCPGKANCSFEKMEMVSSSGEKVQALDYHCRTIVLNHGPFCLSPRLHELASAGAESLRADFIYRPYEPEEVRRIWRTVRSGRVVPGGHAANFDRGMQ